MKKKEEILSAYDAQKESFAIVSSDNRLKVWEPQGGKLRHHCKEATHLSDNYTAMAWGYQTSNKKRGRDSNKPSSSQTKSEDNTMPLVALGTSRGNLIVWDL